ncbi:hypothetical protein MTO96_005575 [Rhipicephalus appendiculatus]
MTTLLQQSHREIPTSLRCCRCSSQTARLTINKRRRLQALQSAVPRQRRSHPTTLCKDHHSGLRDVAVPPTVTKINGDSDRVGRDVWCS